jgi:hypothetical protein
MIYEFNSLNKSEKNALYVNLFETYTKSTGVLTFSKRTFTNKFKNTTIAGNLNDGGFIIRTRKISYDKYYKLVAGFSRWFDHFADLETYIYDKNAFIFVTDNLVPTFETNGFTSVLDSRIIKMFMNREMVFDNGIKQRIKNVVLKKRLLFKFNKPESIQSKLFKRRLIL